MKRWLRVDPWIRVRHSFLFRRFFAKLSWLGNKLKKDQNGDGIKIADFIRQKEGKGGYFSFCENTTLRTSVNHGCPRDWGSFLVVTSYLYDKKTWLRMIHPPVKLITPSGPSRPVNKWLFEKKDHKMLVSKVVSTHLWNTPLNLYQ